MKKALLLTIALSMVLVSGAMAGGANNAPSVGVVPTVIVSDANSPGQTADNYFVYYSGLDLDDYIVDEDVVGAINTGVQVGFTVADEDRNLSLNAISRARDGYELDEWRDTGAVPAHKDIIGLGTTLDIRAVSELWSATGGENVPLYSDDPFMDPYAIGPYYAFDAARSFGQITWPRDEVEAKATAALVDLLVSDDQGNTVTSQFLVKLSDGPSTLTGEAILQNEDISDFSPGDQKWNYFGLQGSFFNVDFVAPGSYPRPHSGDYLTLNSRNADTWHPPVPPPPAPPGEPGYWEYDMSFGFWKRDYTFGVPWGDLDGLVRARWTLDMGSTVATDAGVPGVRSRIRPGGEGRLDGGELVGQDPSFLPYKGLNSEMRLEPIFDRDLLIANENLRRMRNDKQIELRHYHESGTYAEQLASTYGLQFAIDIIDLRGVTSGTLTIDGLLLDLLQRPTGSDLLTLVKETGAQLEADPNWLSFGTGQLGPINPDYPGIGSFEFTKNSGGLRITGGIHDSNIWGFWTNIALDETKALILDNQLVRLRMLVHDDLVSTTVRRSDLRLRLLGSDSEAIITLNIFSYVDFLTSETFVIPDPAGTSYDVYMQAPLVSPVFGNGQWQVAVDAINMFTPGNPFLNPPGVPEEIRFAADWRISEIALDQVLTPY